jgi:hypothetical protein
MNRTGLQPPVLNPTLRCLRAVLLLQRVTKAFCAGVLPVDDGDNPDVRIGLHHARTFTPESCS